MIFDCFSFFNEFDILEIRLNVLKDVVDRFVLVEATRRHSGELKRLFFEENKERFAPFLDRIIHVVVEDSPALPEECPKLTAAWAYENHQRNAILRGLAGVQDDDTILISDLDEIPDPALVRQYAGSNGVMAFDQLSCHYYLNFVSMDAPVWRGTKMLTWRTFRNPDLYVDMPSRIVMPEFANKGPTPTRVRFLEATRILKGGWHFSYYGGVTQIQLKLKSIADHVCDPAADVSLETIERRIAEGRDPMDRGGRFCAVPLDERFPAFVRENRARFLEGILVCERIAFANRLLMNVLPVKRKLVDFVGGHIPQFLKPIAYWVYHCCARNPIPLMRDQLAQKADRNKESTS